MQGDGPAARPALSRASAARWALQTNYATTVNIAN